MNRTKQLHAHGQSIWLDYIRRNFVVEGELRKLIEEDDLTGITSNPTIFDEAIARGDEYENAIQRAAERNLSADETYTEIAIADVQMAADEFREVFERTKGADGYVSLEVSPHLAYDTEGTVKQARELWERVRREAAERGADTVVVGLPRELDGSEGPAAEDARRLAADAERETGLRVELWDERFTSAEAERALIAGGMRRDRRRETVDGVAAALMLQGWLDAHRPPRPYDDDSELP